MNNSSTFMPNVVASPLSGVSDYTGIITPLLPLDSYSSLHASGAAINLQM